MKIEYGSLWLSTALHVVLLIPSLTAEEMKYDSSYNKPTRATVLLTGSREAKKPDNATIPIELKATLEDPRLKKSRADLGGRVTERATVSSKGVNKNKVGVSGLSAPKVIRAEKEPSTPSIQQVESKPFDAEDQSQILQKVPDPSRLRAKENVKTNLGNRDKVVHTNGQDGQPSMEHLRPPTSDANNAGGRSLQRIVNVEETDSARQSYLEELQALISQHRRYPKRAIRMQQEGVVRIAFKINAVGEFGGIRLLESSGYSALDNAALSAISGLKRFKPLPDELSVTLLELSLPIQFVLH